MKKIIVLAALIIAATVIVIKFGITKQMPASVTQTKETVSFEQLSNLLKKRTQLSKNDQQKLESPTSSKRTLGKLQDFLDTNEVLKSQLTSSECKIYKHNNLYHIEGKVIYINEGFIALDCGVEIGLEDVRTFLKTLPGSQTECIIKHELAHALYHVERNMAMFAMLLKSFSSERITVDVVAGLEQMSSVPVDKILITNPTNITLKINQDEQ